ncbi:hypothetical protein LXL04_002723 [Taraxacum kok-saghyz]
MIASSGTMATSNKLINVIASNGDCKVWKIRPSLSGGRGILMFRSIAMIPWKLCWSPGGFFGCLWFLLGFCDDFAPGRGCERVGLASNSGPPRWFCLVFADGNDSPLPNSPVLLFLPGMNSLGLGLILHHKALRKDNPIVGFSKSEACTFKFKIEHHLKVSTLTCTQRFHSYFLYEYLVTFVAGTLRFEHALFPSRPIYIVGDSFGGCLALAVAARNPSIDLVVVLSNLATSFDRSQLQPVLSVLEVMPDTLHGTIPYLLSFVMGDPIKMVRVTPESSLTPNLEKLADNRQLCFLAFLGKDNMIPNKEEGFQERYKTQYIDNGHTLLLEDSINLLTIIKGNLLGPNLWFRLSVYSRLSFISQGFVKTGKRYEDTS